MQNISIRKANRNDCELLYRWASDDDVRNNSFSPDKFSFDQHKIWFNNLLNDNFALQYILISENGIPKGQIRINISGQRGIIDYSIDRDERGKGLGKIILNLLADEVSLKYPNVKFLVGRVKENNLASKKTFESLGYMYKDGEYVFEL